MSNGKNDKDFQEYLRGDTELSRRYQQAGKLQEPPGYLDKRILEAAETVFTKQKKLNWYVPVSVAAVMLIGVSLLFRIHEGQEQQLFNKPEMNGMINNESGLGMHDKSVQKNPETLPAAPAADVYHAPDDSRNVPLIRETPEGSTAGKRILKEELESLDVQHNSGERISIPAEKKELSRGSSESFIKKQDKADSDESTGRGIPGTGLPAESGVQSSGEYKLEEQPVGSPAGEKMFEPSGVISTTLPAEKWLEEISNQWNTGNKEEAIANLRRFLKSYPEYSKPELVKRLPNDFDLSNIAQ